MNLDMDYLIHTFDMNVASVEADEKQSNSKSKG